MTQHSKVILFLLLLIICFKVLAFDLTKVNLSYQYDLNDLLQLKYRVTQSGENLSVYFHVSGDSLAKWEQTFLIQEDYKTLAHDTLTVFSLDTLSFSPSSVILKLTFDQPNDGLLIISFYDLNRGSFKVYDVPVKSPLGFPSFVPVDNHGLPVFDNYVTGNHISVSGGADRHHIFQYTDEFPASDPAMGMMKTIAPTLRIDSSFYFENSVGDLSIYSFYLVQEDTFSDNGVTILNCPAYYPEYKHLEELVGPLTYITTPNEIKTLNEQMTKKAFENFWLNTYNTKLRAKSAIKRYYDRVEMANRLFTDYKQGWKTDRGMLYIIFGPPDQVIRSNRFEIWRYTDGTEFEFVRLSTLFTPSLYSLKRDRKYEKIWYSQVGNIRKGL